MINVAFNTKSPSQAWGKAGSTQVLCSLVFKLHLVIITSAAWCRMHVLYMLMSEPCPAAPSMPAFSDWAWELFQLFCHRSRSHSLTNDKLNATSAHRMPMKSARWRIIAFPSCNRNRQQCEIEIVCSHAETTQNFSNEKVQESVIILLTKVRSTVSLWQLTSAICSLRHAL